MQFHPPKVHVYAKCMTFHGVYTTSGQQTTIMIVSPTVSPSAALSAADRPEEFAVEGTPSTLKVDNTATCGTPRRLSDLAMAQPFKERARRGLPNGQHYTE